MTTIQKGSLQVASAAAIWGLWSIFLRWSALPGLTAAALLMSLLAVSGIPAQLRGWRRRPAAVWGWMALFGLLDSGNTGFFFLAVAHGSVALATLCHYLAPLLTPLTAWLFLRERPSARTSAAALVGLVGLACLLLPNAGASRSEVLWSAAFGAASAVFYATLVPLGKKVSSDFGPTEVQSYHSYVSAAVLWGLVAAVHGTAPPLAGAIKLLLGGCLCGLVAGYLLYRGIRTLRAGLASVLTYLEPLVATAVGVLVFGETVGAWGYLGASLVIGSGVYLVAEDAGDSAAPGERATA